jgi:hypothetical protein
MKRLPAVSDLVVMNHEQDATMFRVKERGGNGRLVGIIDATIEDQHPNQRIQYVDISLCHAPTVGQLAAFNK